MSDHPLDVNERLEQAELMVVKLQFICQFLEDALGPASDEVVEMAYRAWDGY